MIMMTGELLTLKKEVSAFFHECTFLYIKFPYPSHTDRYITKPNHSTSTNLVYFACYIATWKEANLQKSGGIGVRQ